MKWKTFFIVFKWLSFGEKIKISQKLADTSFKQKVKMFLQKQKELFGEKLKNEVRQFLVWKNNLQQFFSTQRMENLYSFFPIVYSNTRDNRCESKNVHSTLKKLFKSPVPKSTLAGRLQYFKHNWKKPGVRKS